MCPNQMLAVISKLTYHRHFGMLDEIPDFDIPWSLKLNAAIWRGALTGQKRDGFSLRERLGLPPKEMCLQMHRCRLVLHTADSDLVNANLVGLPGKKDLIPEMVEGVKLYGEKASYSEMLQFKAIIMLEGNGKSAFVLFFEWALLI
jgi:hypothetical protein